MRNVHVWNAGRVHGLEGFPKSSLSAGLWGVVSAALTVRGSATLTVSDIVRKSVWLLSLPTPPPPCESWETREQLHGEALASAKMYLFAYRCAT